MTTPVSDLLRFLGLKLRNRGDVFSRSLDMSEAQARTIGYIDYITTTEHRGVIQRELAQASGTSAASVSSLIDSLEKGGYVERRPSADDVRRKEIHLLPKATELTDAFARVTAQAEKDLLSPLTPEEQTTLLELLRRIDADFDPFTGPRGPHASSGIHTP